MTSQKENIYNPFTDKYSTMNKYGTRAKQIYKYLIDETGADADFVLPQGLSYNEDTGRFVRVKQQLDTTTTKPLFLLRLYFLPKEVCLGFGFSDVLKTSPRGQEQWVST